MAILTDPNMILEFDDDTYAEVDVPEWKATVRVRSIGAAEREDLLKTSVTVNNKTNEKRFDSPTMRVKLVWLAVVDEDGNRVFKSQDQLKALGKKNAAAIDRVAEVALRLAGLNDDVSDEDEAGKDSPATSDAGSATE